jgi:hypothetical protein
VKLKPLRRNTPLILAIILVAAGSLLVLNANWDRTLVVPEELASVQSVGSGDWSNCNITNVPLEIVMEVQGVTENDGGAQERGGLVEILLSMKPLLESRAFSWHLELPSGVKAYSGPSSWTGVLGKEETASFVVTISVPDGKEYYVDAVGEYEAESGARVRKAKSLKVDLGEEEAQSNPSFIRVDESGRGVVTYKGHTAGGGE